MIASVVVLNIEYLISGDEAMYRCNKQYCIIISMRVGRNMIVMMSYLLRNIINSKRRWNNNSLR